MNKPDLQIKYYRQRAGLSRRQLSELIGVSVYDLTCMEKGTLMPTFENIQLIAHACHTSEDEIMGLSEQTYHPEFFPEDT